LDQINNAQHHATPQARTPTSHIILNTTRWQLVEKFLKNSKFTADAWSAAASNWLIISTAPVGGQSPK
jgi:hypothetical protein